MDLKLKDVSDLINVSESTLRRWVSEGKIPGYRINRQYRFSRTEIEDWLIQQKIDRGLEENRKSHMKFSLYRAINRGEVLTDLPGTTKEEIFSEALKVMANKFDLDASVLTELFLDRESKMATALGHGIAVPHTRDFLLDTHYDVVLVVYPKTPLKYGALDGESVHTLFFLFAAEDRNHLNLLAKVAHLSSQKSARDLFCSHPSKETLLDFIKKWESSIN